MTMRTGNKYFTIATTVLLTAIAYGTWCAARAKSNLVTLDVRNMDVRRVIAKIEWQTWESISVHKDVQGKVTLNVRKMPLEQVLKIVGDQTSSRWSALYPLYSGALRLAVIITPAAQPSFATANARSGVGTTSSNRYASIPAAASAPAVSSASSRLIRRPSNPTATEALRRPEAPLSFASRR